MFMALVVLKRRIKGLLICLISIVFTNCTNHLNQKSLRDNLGLNVDVKKNIFSWQESYGLQGEGYTIDILKFKNNKNENLFLTNREYPIKKDLRNDWEVSNSQKTPFDKKEALELLFAYKIENKDALQQIENLKVALKSKNNFISYYYKENEENQDVTKQLSH